MPAITAGKAKKYFHAKAALMMKETRNEATIRRTRMASVFAKEATCQSTTACKSRNALMVMPNPKRDPSKFP
jgi:hypothetical protein